VSEERTEGDAPDDGAALSREGEERRKLLEESDATPGTGPANPAEESEGPERP
jgi:hypothetical protein